MSAKDIWNALINAGASTIQAAGIMGNMVYESGLNPESKGMDSNGAMSYGLVQWNAASYPSAHSLVTGNYSADLNNQIRFLAQTGGFRAASGSSASEAGGNFAAKYERCAGCQPGGAQWQKRSAKAAEMLAAATSGNWPTAGSGSGGSTTPGGSQAVLTSAATADPTCAWGFTSPSTPQSIFGLPIPSIGGNEVCFFKKTGIRHLAGIGIMAGVVIVGLVGAIILVAYGMKASQAETRTKEVIRYVPYGQKAFSAARRSNVKGKKAPANSTYSDSEFMNA